MRDLFLHKPRFYHVCDLSRALFYHPFERAYWRLQFDRVRVRVCLWLYRKGYWQLPPQGDCIFYGRLTLRKRATYKRSPWRGL